MDHLTDARTQQLLDEATYAHIAVVAQGDPYVTATSFVRIEEELFFRSFPGRRVDALESHPRASVSIVDFDEATGTWESVLVMGDVTFVDDAALQQQVIGLFLNKYHNYQEALDAGPVQPAMGSAVIFGVQLDEVTGLGSGKWLTPPTRPGRL